MIINTELLVQALLTGWFITNFGPLQSFINWILPQNQAKYFSCLKCCSFWACLAIGAFKLELSVEQLVFTAILSALLAWLWSNTVAKWISQIKQYV